MEIDSLFAQYGIPIPVSRNKSVLEGRHKEIGDPPIGSVGSRNRLSYAQILSGERDDGVPIKESPPPRVVGGNIAIIVEEEEYDLAVAEFRNSLIGRLVLQKGDKPLKNDDLKKHLSTFWRINGDTWKLIPLGRGYFNLHMQSGDQKSLVFSKGAVFLKPGVFRVSEWQKDFNPYNQKQTNSQVWVRFHELPLEYWRPSILYAIGRGVGAPLKIDQKTLDREIGVFARMLVDVDLAKPIPKKILIQKKEMEFFVFVEVEKCPSFCLLCGGIGHVSGDCRRNKSRTDFQKTTEVHRPTITRATRVEQIEDSDDASEDGRLFSSQHNADGISATDRWNTEVRQNLSSESSQSNMSNRDVFLKNLADQIMDKAAMTLIEEAYDQVFGSQGRSTSLGMKQQENMGVEQIVAEDAENLHGGTLVEENHCNVEHKEDSGGSNVRQGEGHGNMGAATLFGMQTDTRPDAVIERTAINIAQADVDGCTKTPSETGIEGQLIPKEVPVVPIQEATMSDVSAAPTIMETGSVSTPTYGYSNVPWTNKPWSEVRAQRKQAKKKQVSKSVDISNRFQLFQNPREEAMMDTGNSHVDFLGPRTRMAEDRLRENHLGHKDENLNVVARDDMAVEVVAETQENQILLDPERIYWDEEAKVYVRASGMHFDPHPSMNTFYTMIDHSGELKRTLYYIQLGGDFSLAMKGKFGKNNKILLNDESWDRNLIYNVKSPRYHQGLLKMFKEKFKEDNIFP